MGMLSYPAFGPKAAISYITVGAIMDVWTTVWYFVYIRGRTSPVQPQEWFWLAGLFFTGLTLIAIGMLLGPIGRSARRAELPPPDAAPAEAAIQQTAAAVPNPVIQPGVGLAATQPPPVSVPAPVNAPPPPRGAVLPGM